MKNYFVFLVMLAIVASCAPSQDELPEDLEGLKVVQRDTKKEISDLQSKLAEVEDKMRSIDPTLFEKPKKLVTGLELSTGDFERFIELQGSVKADETVYVSSETGGRITKLTIKDGDYVAKGRLIASVDLEALDKKVAEVETSLALARQVFERQKRLWDQNIGTEIQYLEAKNRVETLEKSIESLRFEQTKANIYSPISGEVAIVNKDIGEVTGPGEPIATLLNTRKLKISVDVPENLLPRVNRGDYVTVRIPAIEYEKQHKIKRIGTQINEANRTIPVEVEVYNGSGKIKPNLLATMLIKDFESEDVISIPNTLLQQEVSGRYFVYTIEKEGADQVVKKNYVIPGESYEDKIVITEGLNADDILIDKGSRQVAAGEFLNVESIISVEQLESNAK